MTREYSHEEAAAKCLLIHETLNKKDKDLKREGEELSVTRSIKTSRKPLVSSFIAR